MTMHSCFFATDLHGGSDRYEKLFAAIATERPAAVFLGGDLLPSGLASGLSGDPSQEAFITGYLAPRFDSVRRSIGAGSPRIFLILGNDDGRLAEAALLEAQASGLWEYAHNRRIDWLDWTVYGYGYIPPSPFSLKDWERYDVSRFVDPGCVSPEEGWRTVAVSEHETKFSTMASDLVGLAAEDDLSQAIFLFHAPPYRTNLDRAALDGRAVDHAPVDVNIGSIAIRRFIEMRQPLVTLHGHVHESASLTGTWRDAIGRTHCLSAAHHGPELALVRFDPARPEAAERELL